MHPVGKKTKYEQEAGDRSAFNMWNTVADNELV
jgi:hypothetical protein